MHLKIVVLMVVLALPRYLLACEPMLPTIIPPTSPDGDFTYLQPPTELEWFVKNLEKGKDVAVVSVYIDFHQAHQHGDAQTEFRVLYGWGSPHREIVKFIRRATSCGDPEPLEVENWYVAIFSPNGPALMKYDLVKKHIKNLGPYDYVHTSIGVLPK